MNKIKNLIIGLFGAAAIGLVTYYLVENYTKSKTVKKTIINLEKDTIAEADVIQDSVLVKITNALSIEGESFTLTADKGVYTNETKDKILVIKEDIWKKLIQKTQKKFSDDAEDCANQYSMPDLSNYNFIGLLTYFSDNKNEKLSIAYRATEIRKGELISYAGGNICCNCDGEPLVPQKIDAVIVK